MHGGVAVDSRRKSQVSSSWIKYVSDGLTPRKRLDNNDKSKAISMMMAFIAEIRRSSQPAMIRGRCSHISRRVSQTRRMWKRERGRDKESVLCSACVREGEAPDLSALCHHCFGGFVTTVRPLTDRCVQYGIIAPHERARKRCRMAI